GASFVAEFRNRPFFRQHLEAEHARVIRQGGREVPHLQAHSSDMRHRRQPVTGSPHSHFHQFICHDNSCDNTWCGKKIPYGRRRTAASNVTSFRSCASSRWPSCSWWIPSIFCCIS